MSALGLLVLLLIATSAGTAQAATLTWIGADGGNWSVATNWSPNQVPSSSDELVFNSGASSNNNLIPLTVVKITFSAAHIVHGQPITVTGGIDVTNGVININPHVTLSANQSWTVGAAAHVVMAGSITIGDGVVWTVLGAGYLRPTSIAGNDISIVKDGDGILNIEMASTFSGPVAINHGLVVIATASSFGVNDNTAANGTTVSTGAELVIQDTVTVDEFMTISGTGRFGDGAVRVQSPAPLTFLSPVVLPASASFNADQGYPSNTLIFQGAVTGPGSLVIHDTTIVTVSAAANTFNQVQFSGEQDGVLQLGHGAALANTGGVVLPPTATFDLGNLPATVRFLSGAGAVVGGGNSPSLTIDNTVDATFTGSIAQVGDVVKRGTGELVLGGINDHIGVTSVEAGRLRFTTATAVGMTGSVANRTEVSGQGTLILDGVTATLEWITLKTGQPTDAPTLQAKGPTPITLFGRVEAQAGAIIAGTAGADLTLASVLDAAGALRVDGVILHATNPTNVLGGRLTIANGTYDLGATGHITMAVPVTLEAGGVLNLQGKSVSLIGLTGAGTLALGTNGLVQHYATGSVFSGTITGSGDFRNMSGTLTLAGPTTFTGTCRVQGGELIVGHSQALVQPALTVMSPGVLTYAVASAHTGTLSLSSAGSGPGNAGLQVKGGNVTIGGATTVVGTPTLLIDAPHTLTFQGMVNGHTMAAYGTGAVVFAASGNGLTELVVGAGGPALPSSTTARIGVANAFPVSPALSLATDATFDVGAFSQTLTQITGDGRLAVGAGGTLTLQGQQVSVFTGTFHGPGNVDVNTGGGTFGLHGTHTLSGIFRVTSRLFVQDATMPARLVAQGEFLKVFGTSTLGPLDATEADDVYIGDLVVPSTITLGGLTTDADTEVVVYLASPAPAMTVNGTVQLAGEIEFLLTDPAPSPTVVLTVIANDGTDAIAGTFSNGPDGGFRQLQNRDYRLDYRGPTSNDITLTPPITTYHLSEGATGSFFQTDLLIANPTSTELEVVVTYLPENGAPIQEEYFMHPMTRRTIRAHLVEGLESASFSTIVRPDREVPIVVERTMRWDASGYGAHTEKATSGPASTWYFAEGSEGFFRTFLLLANPQTTANVARVTYLREGNTAIERTYDLTPSSRRTIQAADDPELVGQAFGMKVTFDQPGVAERSMYFGVDPIFKGGHESAGVTAPSTTWLLAEGATGSGFDTFILVSNPGTTPADVTFTFLPASGPPAAIVRTLAAQSRMTINPEAESLPIPEGPLGTQVTATQPVIAERAQYWPFGPMEWTEAHNSFGVTEAATKWGLAEGRAGGIEGYQTYILLANAGSSAATVTLTFLPNVSTGPEAPAAKTVVVPAQSRVNVPVDAPPSEDPQDPVLFGTLIASDQPIVVERAMYWNVGGVVWAAGTNATATRLP